MTDRPRPSSSASYALNVGSFHLDVNDFGDVERRCLERIAEELLPSPSSLSVRMIKEDASLPVYHLQIQEEGITIRAGENSIFPALSGLQALIFTGNGSSCLPICTIKEETRFSYRGVMVDDARHCQGTKMLKELMDVMFRLKFNVLHWHIADDQGFRIPLPDHPALNKAFVRNSSNIGGNFKNHPDNKPYEASYTVEEVREILQYAKERGIRIIPEIDMPGHHSAILYCYPQYACGKDGSMAPKEVPGRYGVLDNVLCLGKKEARDFAKNLALSTARFLESDTIHIGFDEIKADHMYTCPDCRKEAERRGLKDPAKLIPLFREEVRDYLLENGISSLAWNDESAFSGPDPKMTVIHWRPETNQKVVHKINQGQKTVMSGFYHYYLDYPYSMTPLKKTYRFEPILKGIVKEENVIGTECPLWSEFISTEDKFRFNTYYRLAAVSKITWSHEKPSYKSFLTELREKEAYWFGRQLAIPDNLLDPPLFSRIRRLQKCLTQDADYEIKLWKQK